MSMPMVVFFFFRSPTPPIGPKDERQYQLAGLDTY
jgi:hypothetical protein